MPIRSVLQYLSKKNLSDTSNIIQQRFSGMKGKLNKSKSFKILKEKTSLISFRENRIKTIRVPIETIRLAPITPKTPLFRKTTKKTVSIIWTKKAGTEKRT